MAASDLLTQILFLFGVGFLIANLRVLSDFVRFRTRVRAAVLVWPGQKPRFYRFGLLLAAVLALLVAAKLVQRRPPTQMFGEAMMLVYYGCALPLSTRILRGFYADGVWSDNGFVRWAQISAVSWKEEAAAVTLVLISRLMSIARRLDVPGELYGQARKVLREQVKAHHIQFGGAGLDLGSRDESDAV